MPTQSGTAPPEVQRRARRGLVQRTRCRALRGQGERSVRCAADRIVLLTPGRNARGHHGTHRVEAGLRGHPAARPSRAAPRSTALRSSPTCFVAQRAARAKKHFGLRAGYAVAVSSQRRALAPRAIAILRSRMADQSKRRHGRTRAAHGKRSAIMGAEKISSAGLLATPPPVRDFDPLHERAC